MKQIVLLLAVLFTSTFGFAQKKNAMFEYNKSKKEKPWAFPSPEVFAPGGWQFGIGLTSTFCYQTIDLGAYTSEPALEWPGLDLEFGRYLNFGRGFPIHYLDYSIGYKSIRGREVLSGAFEGESSFADRGLNIDVNFNNVISITELNFIQNSIGVNADYALARSAPMAEGYPLDAQAPSDFIAQVHYKLGLGYLMDSDRAIVISLETPIFNITPNQGDYLSRMVHFNTPFSTVILKANILLFRLGPVTCPPVNQAVDPNDLKKKDETK